MKWPKYPVSYSAHPLSDGKLPISAFHPKHKIIFLLFKNQLKKRTTLEEKPLNTMKADKWLRNSYRLWIPRGEAVRLDLQSTKSNKILRVGGFVSSFKRLFGFLNNCIFSFFMSLSHLWVDFFHLRIDWNFSYWKGKKVKSQQIVPPWMFIIKMSIKKPTLVDWTRDERKICIVCLWVSFRWSKLLIKMVKSHSFY